MNSSSVTRLFVLAARSIVAVFIASVLAGCVSPSSDYPVVPENRPDVGQVAVVAFSNAPFRVQRPYTKTEIMQEPQSHELISPSAETYRDVIAHSVQFGPQAVGAATAAVAASPFVLIGTAAVAHEVRRIYGSVIADTDQAVEKAEVTFARVLQNGEFERRLGDSVRATLPRAADGAAVDGSERTVAPRDPSAVRSYDAPGMTSESDYSHLSARGIDTVLELKVHEPQLTGSESINPGLGFSVHVRARLISTRTGREFYYDYLEFQGERRTFVQWAAEDARAFRGEINRAIDQLASEIVAQAFVREGRVSPQQLAAAGLQRRSGSQGWRPAAVPSFAPAVRLAQGSR